MSGSSPPPVECEEALRYLKRVYANVTDARFDARVKKPLLVPIEPAVEHGWTPVEAGDAMRLHIQKLCRQDNKTVGTMNEIRRTYVISGKMGAGKTRAVLEFTVDWMKRGRVSGRDLLGPEEGAGRERGAEVEQLEAEREGVHDRSNICAVVVDRIYHDAPRSDKPVVVSVKKKRTCDVHRRVRQLCSQDTDEERRCHCGRASDRRR